MLPKFASHVFHHTQRAAQAAAQNHALRNVLGLQNQGATSASSSGPLSNWTNAASSGSSWGSAGGAKYNTGSRFYQGYTGAGRAVTQANSTSAHDNSNGRADDDDDLPLTRRSLVINSRHRPRSNSLHLTGTGRQKRAETFGVLRTVQLHQARSSHALATATGADSIETKEERTDSVASPRVLVRRNSTAASNASDIESLEPLEPLKLADEVSPQTASLEQAPISAEEALSVDPSAPQTVLPPSEPAPEDARDNVGEKGNSEFARRLQAARIANDDARVVSEVLQFRSSGTRATVRDYNEALYSLVVTRKGGQPITVILETYNDMLTRQVAPNVRTYKMMILALCERDREVERVCSQYEWRQKRRELSGRTHGNAYTMDQKNLELLREEDNFTSAMLVFQAAQTLFRDRDGRRLSLGPEVYSTLLRSCMIHANTDSAVRIWGAIESIRGYIPDATSYLHLLGTYTSAGDLDSAQDVFEEFLLAAKENRVSWPAPDRDDLQNHILSDDLRSGKARASQMLIWVKMIEAYFRAKQPVKALNLLEQMMDSSAPVAFGPTDVPLPCASVYSAFIRGFVENDDIQSALAWFNRMLEQDSVSRHPLIPSAKTPRPDQNAWNAIMEALIERGMLAEANKKFKQLTEVADVEGLTVRMFDRVNVFTLNVENLRTEGISSSEFEARVKFIKEHIIDPSYMDSTHPLGPLEYQNGTFADFLTILCEHSKAKQALEILERHGKQCSALLNRFETDMDVDNGAIVLKRRGLHDLIRQVLPAMLYDNKSVSLDLMAKVDKLLDDTLCFPGSQYNFFLMKKYLSLKSQGELQQLGPRHWMMLSKAAVRLLSDEQFLKRSHSQGFGLDELKVYMKDAVYSDYDRRTTWHTPSPEVANLIMEAYGETEAYNIFSILGHKWTRFVTSRGASPASYGNRDLPTPIRIDREHSRRVDEYFPASPVCTPQQAWARYEEGVAKNVYPTPDVVGRLIATFGRLNDMEKVHRLYADGQRVLAAYENDKELQSVGWYAIEDQMIIGLAHAGHIEKAHIHRQRIIDQGGNPSPDAYGALIQCVRETTDDSANALALWHESQMRGVVANLYLYNTVISKLSRARKADFALELFQQMKANFVRPSSVTYGAVIAACCRVGDAQSAEVLFEEMTSQKNFKPRIPPYNTMIQFYTHIVRDRERALHYFGLLLASGIKPTAHTYKLLIDSYGTIEPTDLVSMEDVFLQLTKDKRVQVQGVHWAALINAWGCIQKDLNRAISIFDSIASHPTTQRSGLVLPDAIVYESMINVLVTLRRTDLIPSYLERLSASGIHMTAYIANLLIKGYAIAGDLERAREVFEGLLDPPTGHAAPNNHVPHSPAGQMNVPSSAPVYREPSTWEAMVRAELGSGNRDRATALLQRVQERHFPPAVYARISGIMLDDSVSPWVSWSPTHNGNMESSSGSHSPQ
ncbi:uncharacterized protein FOMMEDRAFT_125211 [Fomitiporia mediterranea MF3/22]|uniref:uncharacterized protein n=1 Tax=Fomitiporia mediterranea (strain MF3/22) TaxID=694068 RepID=UPI0004409BF0|nr:uncharacterized protein FOMMEDRAFT_125211 [Fomitiporia mediterranea MF3/22]EJD00786.1 hypothetical protein FOMMEDRAFT_125211 [Fomitiporia mediterranea MF3/22]